MVLILFSGVLFRAVLLNVSLSWPRCFCQRVRRILYTYVCCDVIIGVGRCSYLEAEGTEWPETTTGQVWEVPFPIGSRCFFSGKKYCSFVHSEWCIAIADSMKRFNKWNMSKVNPSRTKVGTATNRSKLLTITKQKVDNPAYPCSRCKKMVVKMDSVCTDTRKFWNQA